MRTPADHGLSLFGGQFTVNAALAPDDSPKRPPKGGGKRPPGNGDLGKPLGPMAGNGIRSPLPKSGAKVRA